MVPFSMKHHVDVICHCGRCQSSGWRWSVFMKDATLTRVTSGAMVCWLTTAISYPYCQDSMSVSVSNSLCLCILSAARLLYIIVVVASYVAYRLVCSFISLFLSSCVCLCVSIQTLRSDHECHSKK